MIATIALRHHAEQFVTAGFFAAHVALVVATGATLPILAASSAAVAQDGAPVVAGPLDADVALFLKNNPMMMPKSAFTERDTASLGQVTDFRAIALFALDLCAERWAEFEDQPEVARKRLAILHKVFNQAYGVPQEILDRLESEAATKVQSTVISDFFLSDLNMLHDTCRTAMFEMFPMMNFAGL